MRPQYLANQVLENLAELSALGFFDLNRRQFISDAIAEMGRVIYEVAVKDAHALLAQVQSNVGE